MREIFWKFLHCSLQESELHGNHCCRFVKVVRLEKRVLVGRCRILNKSQDRLHRYLSHPQRRLIWEQRFWRSVYRFWWKRSLHFSRRWFFGNLQCLRNWQQKVICDFLFKIELYQGNFRFWKKIFVKYKKCLKIISTLERNLSYQTT